MRQSLCGMKEAALGSRLSALGHRFSARALRVCGRPEPSRQLRIVIAGATLSLAAPAAAQTRFEWPDTTVRVAQYTTVEQCLAATNRVRSGLERRDELTVWRDTLPRDPQEAMKPAPEPVTEIAARCAARFTEATASVNDFAPLLRLYLAAGRDADAAALLTRRFAVLSAKATGERAAVGDSAIDILLAARPARLGAAEKLLLDRVHTTTDRIDRIRLYHKLLRAAREDGDTTRSIRAARWLLATADSLTTAERESEKFEKLDDGQSGKTVVFDAMYELTGVAVMVDSLRHSTAALVGLEQGLWAQVTGERPEALPFPIGEHAPELTAEYWFPSQASSSPRPAPGHVSLIVFLDHVGCLRVTPSGDVNESCAGVLSTLHRLSERFPALEITVATKTHGSYLYVQPPTPAVEADLVRQWLQSYRVRGAVIAVSSTPFWNLPAPDARRIDKDTPNMTSYSFSKSWDPAGAFLVDQDGIIVSALGFNEQDISRFTDVLLQRAGSASDRAAK